LSSPRQLWTEADYQLLRECVAQGMSPPDIARRLGKRYHTVREYIRRLTKGRDKPKLRQRAVEAPDGRVRDCMCCGRPFWSTGTGHRMCGACRNQSESVFDMDCAVHVHGGIGR